MDALRRACVYVAKNPADIGLMVQKALQHKPKARSKTAKTGKKSKKR